MPGTARKQFSQHAAVHEFIARKYSSSMQLNSTKSVAVTPCKLVLSRQGASDSTRGQVSSHSICLWCVPTGVSHLAVTGIHQAGWVYIVTQLGLPVMSLTLLQGAQHHQSYIPLMRAGCSTISQQGRWTRLWCQVMPPGSPRVGECLHHFDTC